jgi:hypothetical protein|tara:strand:+ start:144 stop:536 length:393 start_codon:yes stop_codon:yes gene_type:complete
MAYKIVTKTEEDLKNVLSSINTWFGTTQDFKVTFTQEDRKFFNPVSKSIENRSIEVLEVREYASGKEAKVKFVPLLISTEVKVEINGEGEFLLKTRISNQMKNKGVLKSYNKDTLKPAGTATSEFKLKTN